MKINLLLILSPAIILFACHPKTNDRQTIASLYSSALSDTTAYSNLKTLCTKYEGRICGTEAAAGAVAWTRQLLEEMGLDTVYLQETTVKRWDRGEKEIAKVISQNTGNHSLSVCSIGWARGTGEQGVEAPVVEVMSEDDLKRLGTAGCSGKIVFFNQPMDPTHYYTFDAYGETAWQRVHGASLAAQYGAKAVIVRSLALALDDYPHTGVMHYTDTLPKIPAVAVSTLGADSLSRWLRQDPALSLYIRTTSHELPDTISYNVIAEMRGSEKPGEIIVFGGHLDAWDNGQGAHDDGVGVIQTIEVLRLFRELGIKPKHTLRVVVFMDEEVDQRGAAAYAESVKQKGEKHIAAIESDRGGFTPQGFSIDASMIVVAKIRNWKEVLEPYGIWYFKQGGSGVDIRDLKPFGIPLMALVTDSQRYFDVQHSPSDSWEKVHPREMQLGSATIASLVYLIDTYEL